MENELIAAKAPTAEDLQRLTTKRLLIEADEPPKLSVIEVLCHNEVTRALRRGEENMIKTPGWKRVFCHFHVSNFKRLGSFLAS